MRVETLKAINQAQEYRRAIMVVTNLGDATDGVFFRGDDIVQSEIADEAEKRFRSGKSGTGTVEGQEVFFNVYLPPPKLVVIGAVHISQALVPMAELVGFDMVVIDPRAAFATEERFAGVTLHAEWPGDVLSDIGLDPYTALVALTHDPKIDDEPLLAALQAECFYVGALGSRKTHAKRCTRLAHAGISATSLEVIHAPIGLDIGAANPAEIAVAIMAEIISRLRTGRAGSLGSPA